MTRTKACQNELEALPKMVLLHFACDNKTTVLKTKDVLWMERGKTCRVKVKSKLIDAEVLALKG